jgi:hypothetical protein
MSKDDDFVDPTHPITTDSSVPQRYTIRRPVQYIEVGDHVFDIHGVEHEVIAVRHYATVTQITRGDDQLKWTESFPLGTKLPIRPKGN